MPTDLTPQTWCPHCANGGYVDAPHNCPVVGVKPAPEPGVTHVRGQALLTLCGLGSRGRGSSISWDHYRAALSSPVINDHIFRLLPQRVCAICDKVGRDIVLKELTA